MGLYLSRLIELIQSWNESTPMRVLLLGLDNAGK